MKLGYALLALALIPMGCGGGKEDLQLELSQLQADLGDRSSELEDLRRVRQAERAELARVRAELALRGTEIDEGRVHARQLELSLDRLTTERLDDSLALRALLTQIAEGEGRVVDDAARFDLYTELAARYPELAGFLIEARPAEASAEIEPEDLDPAAARERAELEAIELLRVRFNALLTVSDVRGLDMLDFGSPLGGIDGPLRGPGRGPVITRLLDGRGRLRGRISAERLTLEGSRAGHSLTLVFENGSRRESGVVSNFFGSTYRLTFRYVDPEPFAVEFPEMFDPERWEQPVDDGTWTLPVVRRQVNLLLGEDPDGQRFRLEWLGGVVGDELRDVELSESHAEGGVRRRLFADRLRLLEQSGWIVLLLEDGVSFQGEVQAPFLDGQLRLVLPRADLDAWQAAELPGLDSSAAAAPVVVPVIPDSGG